MNLNLYHLMIFLSINICLPHPRCVIEAVHGLAGSLHNTLANLLQASINTLLHGRGRHALAAFAHVGLHPAPMQRHERDVRVLEGEAADVHVERGLGGAVGGHVAVAGRAQGAHRGADVHCAHVGGAPDLLGLVHTLGVLQNNLFLLVRGLIAAGILIHRYGFDGAAVCDVCVIQQRQQSVCDEDGTDAIGLKDRKGLILGQVSDA